MTPERREWIEACALLAALILILGFTVAMIAYRIANPRPAVYEPWTPQTVAPAVPYTP